MSEIIDTIYEMLRERMREICDKNLYCSHIFIEKNIPEMI